jgi:type VI secretion system secreted protein VgrG
LPATQLDRPFRLKTPLGDDALLLDSFIGWERVSTPYRYTLRLLSADPNIKMKDLMAKPAVLGLRLDEDKERYIHGHVSRMKLLEFGEDGMAVYEAEMVPWLWFLTLYSNCRIFQHKSVPEILEQVFKDRGFADYKLNLQGSFQPREYCVQYRETDFNFVSRLMEEEGIFYFFEHTNSKHTLVLANATKAFAACPNMPEARYAPSMGGRLDEDTVAGIEHEYRVNTGKASLTDYDFEKPSTDLYATLSGADEGKGRQEGEYYDYPGLYASKADGDKYARLRLEEREVPLVTVRGNGNCMGFECGYKFTLKEHFRDEANQAYSLIALQQRGRNTSYSSGPEEPFEYSNSFECIPNSVPFRPPRLARKPMIHSTQTAVVVGKAGEEIWPDKYGRVIAQFFWDREGKADEKSSCWIRVAQGWAGKQWGAIYIPRMGQEVIVSFLEGDPDRPIITGRVYNAEQMPPYGLPDEKTKSTLKSFSSKGGGGFNELRFEDKKGSEQIFIHAEKNVDIRVKNDEFKTIERNVHQVVTQDHYEHIKHDHHVMIDNDQIVKVTRDHHLNVTGKQAVKVTSTHTLQVGGDVTEVFDQNHSEKTGMNLYVKAGMGIVIEATSGITLKCGSNSVVVDPAGVTVTGSLIVLDGKLTRINSGPGSPAMSGTLGSPVSPTAPTEAQDADQADPGQMSEIQAEQKEQQTGKYGSTVLTPHNPSAAAAANVGADETSAADRKPKTWIEIKLVNKDGLPVPGEKYQVKLPDGTVAEGTLDSKGHARIDGVDPGSCEVTFPDMDETVWDPH